MKSSDRVGVIKLSKKYPRGDLSEIEQTDMFLETGAKIPKLKN